MTPRGRLQPTELATAAVLGGVTVVLVLGGTLIPHAAALLGLAVVPMAVVAHRHRPRAVVASAVAAGSVAFLVLGTGPVPTIGLCAVVGGIAGHARRRRWPAAGVAAAALVAGPALGGLSDLALVVFAPLRRLTLRNIRDTWHGYAKVLDRVPALHPLTRESTRWVDTVIRDWWQTVLLIVVAVTLVATMTTWYYTRGLLARLAQVPVDDRLADASHRAAEQGPPAPLPVTLEDATVRYSGATRDALHRVTLSTGAGRRTVVLGPNGSGKSTLVRLLAGRPPTSGSVTRPGAVGLGRPGGTALVFQRPESQVLGIRVADDVAWGLPRDWPVDVAALLAMVGLAGLEARDTSALSGGQLQRLALAAALARRPALLIGDEVTAMVDAGGRQEIVALLSRLPAEQGVGVVQVTHRLEETAGADRLVVLSGGEVAYDGLPAGLPASRPAPPPPPPARPPGRRVLSVEGVSHTYAAGTPWAQPALDGVSLAVRAGEALLVVGDNGSGKSTLAWVMAGLLRPTEGRCLLDGRDVSGRVGSVALAFQHARLQVQAATVGRDVMAAGGVDRPAAEAALRQLGIEPGEMWDRSVDELSGGQLRRVALAGLVAARPEVLILDEPMAGLDEESRSALVQRLARLRQDRGMTLVVISHDKEAAVLCDRMVQIAGGRLVADEVLAPDGAVRP